jgi:hypothetical protein
VWIHKNIFQKCQNISLKENINLKMLIINVEFYLILNINL